MPTPPKISIITVVYNGAATLEATIKSIACQTYKNVEYIVVDGNSTDTTLDIIKTYAEVIDKWISEDDKGIYDAMNKGMDLATGDYLWFMNSGDRIAQPTTLKQAIDSMPDADIYYGETVMIGSDGKEIGDRRLKIPDSLTFESFKRGMLVSHQSFIVKSSLVQHYDVKYNYSADFQWCLQAIKKAQTICNTRLVLSEFLDGGFTKQNIVPGLKERFRIMVQHYGLASTLYHHVFIALKFFGFVIRHKRF
ncbi:Glycosyltransferase involved in cell wall bisynthesis [Saccharicrinis carchari]|uniref:Glycosyltransferase involved in cell wall bisynthesis n=1 Tax=Saccharicrinis carchari TaxID=1168039 RepID=A0A521CMD9_SACCC|nr:glycosyltransferase family 2 protein [Saccharicrinis carchari]SMO59850.1 Glycosyltransferase involved in cell wall bisynthesis [Saccharicrinis carchari]